MPASLTARQTGVGGALAELRGRAARLSPLPGLSPERYAAGHAAFEQRSTQRAVIRAWLCAHLGRRAGDLAVLSVGCGDGLLDAEVARALAAGGRDVRYDGVDPHPPSAHAFQDAVGAVPGVRSTGHVSPVQRWSAGAAYDVVLAVHSLYYVPRLAEVTAQLAGQLSPGGELVVLLAASTGLNVLAATLAPEAAGHRQAWSGDFAEALTTAGLRGERTTLRGRLRLDDCLGADDVGRQILDFLVQAELPATLRRPVLDHLAALRLPGPGLVVDHPVDAWMVRRP